jgi:lysophospholipase L1-like esterase
VALLAFCLAISGWIVVRVRADDAARTVSSVLIAPRRAGATAAPQRPAPVPAPLAACEARIERQPSRLPVVAIAGASYTAGTGPDNPELSWAVDLARQLRWDGVIYGDPGAGYLASGTGGHGPMARLLAAEKLRALGPALVIVQAGFNDIGVPAGRVQRQVRATVDLIRAAAPHARIALLTTFGYTPQGSPALRALDRAIVTAASTAAPGVIVMDPLAGRWTYPRAFAGALHPSAAGDAWIARTVAGLLAARGVRPASVTPTAPLICDESVGVGKPALS